jgi:predicted dithiol-disulfide oxidoreductase (DUF899 family)
MNYVNTKTSIAGYRRQIAELREKMREAQRIAEPQPVQDYLLAGQNGPVKLSELFGDKRDLIVIHNMGTSCRYCTLWADGFNGALPHLEDRAAFVITSPDSPNQQRRFAESRGWKMRMVSHQGTSFAADMGFAEDGKWLPGVSVFGKRGDEVVRVSDQNLGPGDDFCAVWHFFDMIPEGAAGWQPKYSY